MVNMEKEKKGVFEERMKKGEKPPKSKCDNCINNTDKFCPTCLDIDGTLRHYKPNYSELESIINESIGHEIKQNLEIIKQREEINRLRDGYLLIQEKVDNMDGYESQRLSVIKEIGKILEKKP